MTKDVEWQKDDDWTWVGDEYDGCYVKLGEGEDGWYITVVVDAETGHFVDELVDEDGPYDTSEGALEVGCHVAMNWCLDNGVNWGED